MILTVSRDLCSMVRAAVVILFMSGRPTPAGIVLAVMFGVPLLLILFKEPLTNRLKKEEREDKRRESHVLRGGFLRTV